MTTDELIDIQAANIEVRESQRRAASQRAAEYCGAKSVSAFLLAVEQYQHEITEIERAGKCLWCGWMLDQQNVCVECKRSNS
jgi:hypothetical protein